jgi:hypothetical protein
MGRPPNPGQAKQALLGFHAALLRLQKEQGTVGRVIPIHEWEASMVKVLSRDGILLTPQSCKDKTWFLAALGLIEHRKREGVILQEAPHA